MKRGHSFIAHFLWCRQPAVKSKTIAAQNCNLYLLHGMIFQKRVDSKIPYYIYTFSRLLKSLFNSGKTLMAN